MRVASRRRHPHRRGVLHWSDSISNSRRRRTPGQQINLILPALNPMMASSQTDTGDVRRVHLVVVTEAFRWHKVARTGGRSHVTSRPSPFATQVDNSWATWTDADPCSGRTVISSFGVTRLRTSSIAANSCRLHRPVCVRRFTPTQVSNFGSRRRSRSAPPCQFRPRRSGTGR
jgi:hypothetical protein